LTTGKILSVYLEFLKIYNSVLYKRRLNSSAQTNNTFNLAVFAKPNMMFEDFISAWTYSFSCIYSSASIYEKFSSCKVKNMCMIGKKKCLLQMVNLIFSNKRPPSNNTDPRNSKVVKKENEIEQSKTTSCLRFFRHARHQKIKFIANPRLNTVLKK